MSRKPGIGVNYVNDDIKNYFTNNKNLYATLKDGDRQPLGRYYKEKIKEIGSVEFVRDWEQRSKEFKKDKEERKQSVFNRDSLRIERELYSGAKKKAIRQLKKNNKL